MNATSMTALNLLDALVRIDSVNPGLDPAGAGEKQIAALIACRDAALAGVDGEVVVAAVADEELASLGIQEAHTQFAPASIDGAVVTEPTERQVGTAHRGFVWTEVTVTGVAAHGSRPHLGADAILAAGHLLVAFDALDQELRDRPHPFLGPGNLHASLIRGGTEESTIPDRCVFTVERRTLPGEDIERVEADVADLIGRCRPADQRLTVNARTVLYRPPMETLSTAAVVQELLAVAGPGTSAAPMSYWADSAFLAATGIPTVLYGPEGEGAHADIEWVSRSGTSTAAAVLTQLAQNFCS
jgi:acetylornithine deacetylase